MQPGPNEVGIWVIVAVLLLSAGSSLAVMFGPFKTQRRQVRMEENYATEDKVEKLRIEVKGDITALHEKVNCVSNDVAAVAKNCEMTNTEIVFIKQLLQRRDS
jgi:hypothetical protein